MNASSQACSRLTDFQKPYLHLVWRLFLAQVVVFAAQMMLTVGTAVAIGIIYGDTVVELIGKPVVYAWLLVGFIVEFFLTLYFFRRILNKSYKGVKLTIQNATDFMKETRRIWLKIFLIAKASSYFLLNVITIFAHVNLNRANGTLPYLFIVGVLLYRSVGRKQSGGGGYTLSLEAARA